MSPIKIAIAEPGTLLCHSLVALLGTDASIHTCAVAGDAGALLLAVEAHRPDVVLTASCLPGLQGSEVVQALHQHHSTAAVLVLANPGDDALLLTMVREGAAGFVCRACTSGDDLVRAIHHVHGGRSWLPRLLEAPADQKFTNKELEIIRHICAERPTKQIAALVGLRPRTVEAYRRKIMEKTGAQSRVGVVLYAVKHGIFKV